MKTNKDCNWQELSFCAESKIEKDRVNIEEVFINTIGGMSYLILKELVKRNGGKFRVYEKEIIEIILEFKSKGRVTKRINEIASKISNEIKIS